MTILFFWWLGLLAFRVCVLNCGCDRGCLLWMNAAVYAITMRFWSSVLNCACSYIKSLPVVAIVDEFGNNLGLKGLDIAVAGRNLKHCKSYISLRAPEHMGSSSFLWNFTKKFITAGLITVTVSDRYATVVPVRGGSMSPTLNPKTGSGMEDISDDYVLVEKFCLGRYKFSRGDVVVFRSPLNHKETHIKRIVALPNEWFDNRDYNDVVKIPYGHIWVEGDNSASSMDSTSFGPIPLGLVQGRVTHVVWPPQRIGAVKNTPPQRLPSPPQGLPSV
ncbi:hypothetical protein RJT34_17576 [Clitoria ternatea]|uniref:Mitochondrial inner membrane protease subunit 2 n=1 Tax=Clitoria ternatea TaxID=43366 RepID=A0AAN9J970_CLITE